MAEPIHCTLLNLVRTVSCFAESDDEVTATVAYLVNSGKVRLCGSLMTSWIKRLPRQNPGWIPLLFSLPPS